MIFGKPLSAYLAVVWPFLVLVLVVGLLRLGLSLAGAPTASVRWASMNAVLWAATVYSGVAAARRGFDGYRQLLPLVFLPLLPFHGVAVLGILLAIGGHPNILAAPEFSPPFGGADNQWLHAGAHLTIGIVVPTLLLWGVSSLFFRITKAAAPRPAAA
jgi:hypothetical protein